MTICQLPNCYKVYITYFSKLPVFFRICFNQYKFDLKEKNNEEAIIKQCVIPPILLLKCKRYHQGYCQRV